MSLDALADRLEGALAGRVKRTQPLGPLTTYRLGGPARLYVEPAGERDVAALAEALSASGDVDVLLIGRGSNLVISDEGWPGLAIRLGPGFARVEALGEQEGQGLRAGGASPLPTLANWAARRGLTGLEFLVSVPGSVGGAVRMNAGAHGSEIVDTLTVVRVFDLASGELQTRPASALGLGYRRSRLGARELVLAASFELRADDPAEIRARMDAFRRRRALTQPGALQNAGSVFKNPAGDAAGRLVEAAGLKGFRVGGAAVSELHANFFLASEEASAQDVFDLVQEVRARVARETGVELEPEIRFVGTFRGATHHAGEGVVKR